MSTPIKNLPVSSQNWDCRSCSDCCRIEAVITEEEKRRIEGMDLKGDPEVAAGGWFARARGGRKGWRLRHRADGACVFLTKANRCRIQEKFGEAAKPFVCRLFPFLLIPAGNQWRVGLRFSCPSAASNQGRPVSEAEKGLVELSGLLEAHVGRSAESAPAPALEEGKRLDWPDVCRVVQVLVEIVEDRRDGVERRLRKCLAVARVCRGTTFDGMRGPKLTKYLQAVRNAMDVDVPREATDVPAPDPLFGGVLFRVLLAVFARKDHDGRGSRGVLRRLGRVRAGWRFVRGRGEVPRVNDFGGKTSFEEVERASGPLPELEETLERYYLVKLNSIQFCGPANFDLSVLAGLESLALTLPMILWLRRSFTDATPLKGVEQAIQLVDDHFGGNPMLGFPHLKYLVQTMAQRGEIEKLAAWYSR